MLGICAGLMGPKSENVEKVMVFKVFFTGQWGDENSREVLRLSGRSAFGVILASFWGHFGVIFGVFGVTLGT